MAFFFRVLVGLFFASVALLQTVTFTLEIPKCVRVFVFRIPCIVNKSLVISYSRPALSIERCGHSFLIPLEVIVTE